MVQLRNSTYILFINEIFAIYTFTNCHTKVGCSFSRLTILTFFASSSLTYSWFIFYFIYKTYILLVSCFDSVLSLCSLLCFFLFRFYNFSLLLLFTVAVCCCCGYFLSPFVLLSVYLNLFNFCVVVVALNSLVNYCTIRSSVDSSADFRKYWRRKNCNE